jgi:hypothetical protein
MAIAISTSLLVTLAKYVIRGKKAKNTTRTNMPGKPGLYANIAAKKKRIAAGSGEKMNKVGSKAAPSAADFKAAAKTAKPYKVKK